MAINVNIANSQAVQLDDYATQLRNTKNQLNNYKNSINDNWQGKEVPYISRAIDQVISQIDDTIRQLNGLSSDIKIVANNIKREEDAARAEKQRRIQVAQKNYNTAVNECNRYYDQREALKRVLSRNLPQNIRNQYEKQWNELMINIQRAERKRNSCINDLNIARR